MVERHYAKITPALVDELAMALNRKASADATGPQPVSTERPVLAPIPVCVEEDGR